MKLHLPKLLRNAVLACVTAVVGFATTVGTAAFTGGVVAFTLTAPQALADYTWNGGSGNKTKEDWNNAANWELNGATFAGSGPGTPNSNMWETIHLSGGTEALVIGAAATDSRVYLEGWNPRYSLEGNVTLYATTKKFQGTNSISVNNNSTLDLIHEGGHFEALTVNIGAGSEMILTMTNDRNNGALTLNLNAADAMMTFASNNSDVRNLSGAITVTTKLGDIDAGTMSRQKLGLATQNVTLSNLSFNFGDEWVRTETEITEANYATLAGKYYIDIVDGEYYVVYSKAPACIWDGGDLSWGADTVFSNDLLFTDGTNVNFRGADAQVTMTADVQANVVSIAEGIRVGLEGNSTLTAEIISLGANAQLDILKASVLGSGVVKMGDGAQLNIAVGGSTTIQEVLGDSVTWSGGSIGITNGTTIELADDKLNNANVVVDGEGSCVNVTNAAATFNKNVKLQNSAVMELATDVGSDRFSWGSAQKIEVLSGSELKLNNSRISVQAADQIILNDGKITGAGDSSAALDFFANGGVLVSDGTSSIEGPVRLREPGHTTAFQVNSGTLTAGSFVGNGSLEKTGAGTMVISGAADYAGSTTISAGELVLQGATNAGKGLLTIAENATLTIAEGANRTIIQTISGAGTLNLNGTLTINFAEYTVLSGAGMTYSDGENGYATNLLVASMGQITKGENSSVVVINGEETNTYTSSDITVSDGKMFVGFSGGESLYYVNTDVTYNEETMGGATEFYMMGNSIFRVSDISVLTKTSSQDSTSNLYLDAAGETLTAEAASGYRGNIIITAGTTVQAAVADSLGVNYVHNKQRSIVVENGATLEVGADTYYKVVLNEGATMANRTGAAKGDGSMQNPYIELQGNATIDAQSTFGLRYAGADSTQSETLNLNGHTLTKTGTGDFFFFNTSINAGTIDVKEGLIEVKGGSGYANVDVRLQSGTALVASANNKRWKSLTLYSGETEGGVVEVRTNGTNQLTIDNGITADVLLDKKEGGNLIVNGTSTLGAGATISAGTLTLNGATSLGSVLTVESGATLAINSNLVLGGTLTVGAEGTVTVAQNGSIVLDSLEGFSVISGDIPTENGIASIDYQIIEAASGATVQKQTGDNAYEALTSVVYSGVEKTLTDGVLSLADVYYVVKDTVEYGTVASTSATSVSVLSGATLQITNADATALPLSNGGTINLLGGCKEGSSLNISNAEAGVLNIMTSTGSDTLVTMGGAFSADVLGFTVVDDTKTVTYNHVNGKNYAGELTVKEGATLNVGSGNLNSADIIVDGGTLVLTGAGHDKSMDITVTNGGKLTIADTDTLNWSGGHNISVLNGTMEMGSKRISLNNVSINLTDAIVSGTGDGSNGAFDYIENARGTLTASGNSTVEGTIRLRGNAVITFNVDGEGSLLNVGTYNNGGQIIKTGAGTLAVVNGASGNITVNDGVLSFTESATFTGTATVNSGATIDLAQTGDNVAFAGTIEGSGTLTKTGTGTVTVDTLTSAWTGDVTVTDGTLNLGAMGGISSVTVEGGTLNVAGDVSCAVTNSGALVATGISGASLESTGGSIELTGEGAAITSADISISGTTLKGTWSAAGAKLGTGVTVDTTGTVTLTGADLGGQVTVNAGTLVLSGETTLSGFTAVERVTYADSTNNGFGDKTKVYAGVVSLADAASVDVSGMIVGGYGVSLESDGSLVADLGTGTEYWVTTGTVNYDDTLNLTNKAGVAATGFVLNGAELVLSKDLGSLGVEVTGNAGTITVESGQTLKAASLSGEGVAQLSGAGTYDLGSGLVLGANAALSEGWTGLVTTAAAEITADTTLALGNKVEFTADKLTLGGDLTTAGELILGSELAFGSFESMLTADTLSLRGDSLAIGLDTAALQNATGVVTELISLNTAFTGRLIYGGQDITAEGIAVLESIGKDGLYDAKLSWNGTTLTLSTSLKGGVIVWDDDAADFGENQVWDSTKTDAGTDVAFIGSGSGTVAITGGSAEVNNIVVSNHTDSETAQDYIFTGEDLVAKGNLSLSEGASLTVSNTTTVEGTATVNAGSELKVAEGELTVKGDVDASEATLAVESGTLTTEGQLAAQSVNIAEAGTLSANSVTVTSLVNTGSFAATGVVKSIAPAASAAGLETLPEGGEIQNAGSMVVGGVNAAKFTMVGGTLEITSEAGFSSGDTQISGGTLKADKVAWGIDGGSIGGVTIEGTETITLSNVKLTSVLNNSGSLALSGEVDITALEGQDASVYTDLDGSMSAGGNGYTAMTTLYTLVEGSGTVVTEDATWVTGNADAVYEYSNGQLTEKQAFSKETYYVNSSLAYDGGVATTMAENDTVNVIMNGEALDINKSMSQNLTINSGVVNANAALVNQVALNGGKLNLNSTVAKGIVAEAGTINIGDSAQGTVAVSGKTVGITGGNAAVNLQLSDVTANLALADTKVEALSSKVTVNGTLTDGELVVKQSNTAKGNLELQDSKLTVIIDADSSVLSTKQVNEIADNGVVDLGTMTGDVEVSIVTADGKESGAYAKYYSDFVLEDGKVVALGRNTSYYTDKAGDTVSANAAAGLAMADAALVELNPQASAPKGGLATVLNLLDKANAETADELGASLAGASTAVLGMATQGDVDRQLQAIRNRTTTMGVNQEVANADMPYFNAWINAEGDMSELSENGTESGYQLTSWGGTVGFDVDFCPTFTAGMALTAMYGDLDADGADKATGNLDTQYLSIFARYAPSAWTHTFVGTIGMADISLDRTVAGVQTQGETDGLSFGLMYEVGRVYALDEDGSTCLQPVFNVTWKHTAVDGYTEKGSDLALEVGDQTMDTVTFGVGARLQTVVGESMYNRSSILEARVLAKLDAGDRQGSTDVALAALPDSGTSVDSAEMGAFGLELGAGLTIPVGQDGSSIFADAAVELRSDYTNVNGTVGYRVNF